MKLRNKKTGEIGNLITICASTRVFVDKKSDKVYNTLAELTNEWEDYEEAKGYWYYDTTSAQVDKLNHNEDKEIDSSIGNCFETKEEAEKAVEKLKAWKRLKDKGLRLKHWKEAQLRTNMSCVAITGNMKLDEEAKADLDLLFGGEDE